jgi:hypothetical protein
MTRDLPSPPLVALAGWLLPGSGYWLIGQRTRGTVIGITIITLFVLGIFIAGIRVVEAPDMSASGTMTSRILQRPWFPVQALAGPMGLASAYLAKVAATSVQYHDIQSKSRIAEIGTLYTAIAGMLNLLSIMDCAYRASNHGNR